MSLMSAEQCATRIREAKQFLRLRALRKDAARREHEASLRAVEAAVHDVRSVQAQIEQATSLSGALTRRMHEEAAFATVRWLPYWNATIDRLTQKRERAHDALLAAHRQLTIAQRHEQDLKRRHSTACARMQVIEVLLKRLLAEQAHGAELRLEREAMPTSTARSTPRGVTQAHQT